MTSKNGDRDAQHSKAFGNIIFPPNKHNMEMGQLSQGEQLVGKRKKLTSYITAIDNMLSKNLKR